MTKKGMYNKHLADVHIINGETAVKPYWYLRNGLLHVRYNVDRCIQLSPDEVQKLKDDLTDNPAEKQIILEKAWSFFSDCVGKSVIFDGIAEIEKRVKRVTGGKRHGR